MRKILGTESKKPVIFILSTIEITYKINFQRYD